MNKIDQAFEKFPQIETGRLTLKEITHEYDLDLFKILTDDEVLKFHEFNKFTSIEQVKSLIDHGSEGFTVKQFLRWGISLKNNKNIIGTCGFSNFDRQASRAELGYELAHEYWRHGIMSEALTAVIAFGFGKMDLHRIEAFTDVENLASRRLLEKLMFQHEGIMKERVFLRGKFVSAAAYAILKRDYLKNQL